MYSHHDIHLQGDFGLSLTQDGYLPAAFLVCCFYPTRAAS